MSGDVYHRMACAYWGKNVGRYKRGNSLTDAEITGWEAASRVLLEAQREWMRSTVGAHEASYLAVLPAEFARSIGLELEDRT